jgi:hypothetical protein
MANIFADQPGNTTPPATATTAAHPGWCAADLDRTHLSVDQVVETCAPGGLEPGRVYVSLELDEATGVPAVRLSGATDSPMLAQQAIQIGTALITSAFAAATSWQGR